MLGLRGVKNVGDNPRVKLARVFVEWPSIRQTDGENGHIIILASFFIFLFDMLFTEINAAAAAASCLASCGKNVHAISNPAAIRCV